MTDLKPVSDDVLMELVEWKTDANGIPWVRHQSTYGPSREHYKATATVIVERVAFELQLTWTELKIERGMPVYIDILLHIRRGDNLDGRWERTCTVAEFPRGKAVIAAVKRYGTRQRGTSEAMLLRWLGHPQPPETAEEKQST